MMHDREKSASPIVAAKPTNKAGRLAAEPVERRAETRGKRTSKERAGLRAGEACPKRWNAYEIRKAKEVGTVHHALPPHQSQPAPARLLRAQARCGARRRWADLGAYEQDLDRRIDDLHARGPKKGVPGLAVPASVHTEG